MGETRSLILASVVLLTADIVGGAVMLAALLGLGYASSLSVLGVLVLVVPSLLKSALLVILAERPVAVALGELRHVTGAPVDPSAPWQSIGVRPMAASDLEWDHVVPLIAAANLRHSRARLALSWAVITTTGLCIWMTLSFAIAAVT